MGCVRSLVKATIPNYDSFRQRATRGLHNDHSDEDLDGGHLLYSLSTLKLTFIYTPPAAETKWYLVRGESGETNFLDKQLRKENLA